MYLEDVIEEEKEIAREQGLAEGRAKGREENARSIALNALSMNLSISQISTLTGLTEEEILSLKK